MRKFALLVMSVGLAVPMGVVVAQSASAASGTSCTKGTSSATITPGILKLQTAPNAEKNEKGQSIKSHGYVSSCTGGGVKRGTATYNPTSRERTSCNSTLDAKDPAAPPPTVGVLTVKWNAKGTTTVGSAKLTAV